MSKHDIDAYLTGFEYKPRNIYELNGDNRCPRCITGVIVRDFDDKVCLNCGLREIVNLDIITFFERKIIQWLIRNLPRQLFSTEDYLNNNPIENSSYIKIPAYRGIINDKVQSKLLELARLEQQGLIRIKPYGVISDYENIIVIYDVLDKSANKKLSHVGII